MSRHAYSIEEFKMELRAIHENIMQHLVQCGLELVVTTDEVQKVKVFRIIRDERNPMREFLDLVQGQELNMRVEITMYEPEDDEDEPQFIYNTLMLCKVSAEHMLNAFFSMAEATMRGDKERWEKARTVEPGAIKALESVLSRQTIEEKVREAIERIRLGDLSSIRPPTKSTN